MFSLFFFSFRFFIRWLTRLSLFLSTALSLPLLLSLCLQQRQLLPYRFPNNSLAQSAQILRDLLRTQFVIATLHRARTV
uniref:Putative secreted peptide n=1 Tax=Anopheles braziliensis TaxID=58242 RepID=A0A2M3ZXE4_9DIPT